MIKRKIIGIMKGTTPHTSKKQQKTQTSKIQMRRSKRKTYTEKKNHHAKNKKQNKKQLTKTTNRRTQHKTHIKKQKNKKDTKQTQNQHMKTTQGIKGRIRKMIIRILRLRRHEEKSEEASKHKAQRK